MTSGEKGFLLNTNASIDFMDLLNHKVVFKATDRAIKKELDKYIKMNPDEVAKHRYKKFRTIDNKYLHVI